MNAGRLCEPCAFDHNKDLELCEDRNTSLTKWKMLDFRSRPGIRIRYRPFFSFASRTSLEHCSFRVKQPVGDVTGRVKRHDMEGAGLTSALISLCPWTSTRTEHLQDAHFIFHTPTWHFNYLKHYFHNLICSLSSSQRDLTQPSTHHTAKIYRRNKVSAHYL